jgi:hypothetical protein
VPGVLRRLDLRERRLALEPREERARVADQIADDAADDRADEHRREAEGARDRPALAQRGERGRAEDGAEHDTGDDGAEEDGVRLAVRVLDIAFDDAGIELGQVLSRHALHYRPGPART